MGSDSLYAYGFRYYFTPLFGVLFTFPSRYLFTIGEIWYLALDVDPPIFTQDFTCLVLLVSHKVLRLRGRFATMHHTHFRLQGCHLLWRAFPGTFY